MAIIGTQNNFLCIVNNGDDSKKDAPMNEVAKDSHLCKIDEVARHYTDFPTSCEVLDPTLQSYFLRKEKFAEIAKVLNETIKPMVEATGNKANWDYVCYAFKVLGIVKINLSRKKVASLLVAMCPGIGEASTLESSMEKSSASYQGKYDYEKLKETEQLKIHSKPYIEALQPVV